MVQKSEENLIQVTEDGEHRKRKLKKIIVLLAVFGSVMAGILIYLLTFKNQPRVNYIEPLAQDLSLIHILALKSGIPGIWRKTRRMISKISSETAEECSRDATVKLKKKF